MGVNHQIGGGGVAPMEPSSASRHPSDANHHSNALDQLIKSCASLQCNAEVHERAILSPTPKSILRVEILRFSFAWDDFPSSVVH